jgi:hypothetical protein
VLRAKGASGIQIVGCPCTSFGGDMYYTCEEEFKCLLVSIYLNDRYDHDHWLGKSARVRCTTNLERNCKFAQNLY